MSRTCSWKVSQVCFDWIQFIFPVMRISPPLSICNANGALLWLVQKFLRIRLIGQARKVLTTWNKLVTGKAKQLSLLGPLPSIFAPNWVEAETAGYHFHISEDCFHVLVIFLPGLTDGLFLQIPISQNSALTVPRVREGRTGKSCPHGIKHVSSSFHLCP